MHALVQIMYVNQSYPSKIKNVSSLPIIPQPLDDQCITPPSVYLPLKPTNLILALKLLLSPVVSIEDSKWVSDRDCCFSRNVKKAHSNVEIAFHIAA